jgi:histidine transporter
MNADIYGAGRMLHGLAEQGQAPRSFARTSRNGVPVMTVITMVVALLVGVLLNYLYPDQALFLLGALATFATLLVWLVILAAHLRMKRAITRENRLPSEFPVPLWPLGSWLTVAFILFVLVMVGIVPDSRPALWVGLLWALALWLCYLAFVRGGGRRPHELSDRTEPMGSGTN